MKSESGMLLSTASPSDEFANLQWGKKITPWFIHIALWLHVHKHYNFSTFVNKGVFLILCKAVVCAAVDTRVLEYLGEKVLSIFKIIPNSYSLSLSTKFDGFLKDYKEAMWDFSWWAKNLVFFQYDILYIFNYYVLCGVRGKCFQLIENNFPSLHWKWEIHNFTFIFWT